MKISTSRIPSVLQGMVMPFVHVCFLKNGMGSTAKMWVEHVSATALLDSGGGKAYVSRTLDFIALVLLALKFNVEGGIWSN